jgi:hypothetical protein
VVAGISFVEFDDFGIMFSISLCVLVELTVEFVVEYSVDFGATA